MIAEYLFMAIPAVAVFSVNYYAYKRLGREWVLKHEIGPWKPVIARLGAWSYPISLATVLSLCYVICLLALPSELPYFALIIGLTTSLVAINDFLAVLSALSEGQEKKGLKEPIITDICHVIALITLALNIYFVYVFTAKAKYNTILGLIVMLFWLSLNIITAIIALYYAYYAREAPRPGPGRSPPLLPLTRAPLTPGCPGSMEVRRDGDRAD